MILPFPHCAVRAWVVVPIDDGFRGELLGGRNLLDDGPDRSAIGPLPLVMDALMRRDVRQGLPIIQMLHLDRGVTA